MAISFPKRRKENCHVPEARKLCSLSLAYSFGIPGSSKDEDTYFGREQKVDNCKVAVLSRRADSILFNPRYLDFANHYGFQIRACGVKKPHEKGRVENGVGYVKTFFTAWSFLILKSSIRRPD